MKKKILLLFIAIVALANDEMQNCELPKLFYDETFSLLYYIRNGEFFGKISVYEQDRTTNIKNYSLVLPHKALSCPQILKIKNESYIIVYNMIEVSNQPVKKTVAIIFTRNGTLINTKILSKSSIEQFQDFIYIVDNKEEGFIIISVKQKEENRQYALQLAFLNNELEEIQREFLHISSLNNFRAILNFEGWIQSGLEFDFLRNYGLRKGRNQIHPNKTDGV